ncbi:hypothetical protein M3Y97_00078700 [Aphelenchoides bicaudatus]|nr:hypothetical protein M3Y97_00078700 [Aphelenchoides bicaudatus]
MMRIKQAIERRKIIQQLNDEYTEEQQGKPGSSTPSLVDRDNWSRADSDLSEPNEQIISIGLHQFVDEFAEKLTENHRRALRVTWKRLSEAPKTSGRGTLQIMEKVFDKLLASEPGLMNIFYRSAFLKCLEDRKKRSGCPASSGTIATLRDHAYLMIDFVDAVMCCLFDEPLTKPVWDPATIGRAHCRLLPLGFDARTIWHKLGESFAEVMFSQECVRAYPHAASAWSMFAVALTDKMYSQSRLPRSMALLPYTPTSFSSWSDPSPFVVSEYSSGYNSHHSPVIRRSRAQSRASVHQKRNSSRSRHSSRSTSSHKRQQSHHTRRRPTICR